MQSSRRMHTSFAVPNKNLPLDVLHPPSLSPTRKGKQHSDFKWRPQYPVEGGVHVQTFIQVRWINDRKGNQPQPKEGSWWLIPRTPSKSSKMRPYQQGKQLRLPGKEQDEPIPANVVTSAIGAGCVRPKWRPKGDVSRVFQALKSCLQMDVGQKPLVRLHGQKCRKLGPQGF